MNVVKVSPRGFCLGVVKSIKLAKETVNNYPNKKIYMVGKIVHNEIIVEEFQKMGVILLDDQKQTRLQLINEIEAGSVVIFSAHGTDSKVISAAKAKGLIVVDTKCEWVLKTEDLIKMHIKLGWKIIFVGRNNHPETIALTSIAEDIVLITELDEIDNVTFNPEDKILVTNQTTLSKIDTQEIFDKLKLKFPWAVFKNDLCDATLERQEAVLKLNKDEIDLLLVVGDINSNNSNKLVEIGKGKGIRSILIQTKKDISEEMLKSVNNVAVTAGASTPSIVQLEVIKFLENY